MNDYKKMKKRFSIAVKEQADPLPFLKSLMSGDYVKVSKRHMFSFHDNMVMYVFRYNNDTVIASAIANESYMKTVKTQEEFSEDFFLRYAAISGYKKPVADQKFIITKKKDGREMYIHASFAYERL